MTPALPESKEHLRLLVVSPTLWATHFLLCYVTAAIWCAKAGDPGASLEGIRSAIAWYTAVGLIGIAVIGWEGLRRHSHGTEATTHDLDSPDDRHRFLGFATLLLSGLSAVAVAYAAFAETSFDTCR